jgi:hypothetical protein
MGFARSIGCGDGFGIRVFSQENIVKWVVVLVAGMSRLVHSCAPPVGGLHLDLVLRFTGSNRQEHPAMRE